MLHVLHLLLPVVDEGGTRGREEVEVEALGEDRYRVLCPPRFVYALAVGDEIKTDASSAGFRTLRRSRNLTVWIYVEDANGVLAVAEAAESVAASIGATIEGTPPKRIIITVPLSAGWQKNEVAISALCSSVPGVSWEYANVFDSVTHEPLNLWK